MKKIGSILNRFRLHLLTGLFLFLTLNMHSRTKIHSYHHVIWSDAAGYYVYLPSAFEYRFEPSNAADSVDQKTGNGFRLNYTEQTIETKYTYGVALLQLPFYLAGRIIESFKSQPEDGFGTVAHLMIMLAGVFYSILGLFFLNKTLSKLYDKGSGFLGALFIFTTTSLFYYGIDKTGYAHIYLFFLFSASIFLFQELISGNRKGKTFWLFSCLVLSVLIRPTSIFAVPLILFIGAKSGEEMKRRLTFFLDLIRQHKIVASISLLWFVPQMAYWYYLSGNLVTYSYGEEGFTQLFEPRILELWFSPNNGLFLYSPIVAFLLIALLIPGIRNAYTLVLLLVFLCISWVFASWHDWTFGCSFGSRSFTEYMVFFAFPLTALIFNLKSKGNRHILLLTCILISYIAFVNINTIYTYDDCFYGETWDFESYFRILRLF